MLPDGSLTLEDPGTGEYFHNKAGAFEEAWFQYVLPSNFMRLMQNQTEINVLDACFGLGYNSWCFLKEVLNLAPMYWPNGGSIKVWAIEKDVSLLQFYPHVLSLSAFETLKPFYTPCEHNVYYQTQAIPSQKCVKILEGTEKGVHISVTFVAMSLRWTDGDWPFLKSVLPLSGDLVFHDPFSPRKMPALWTLELFQQYFEWLKPTECKPEPGRLLTYSSANAVRGALRQSGFQIFQTTPLGAKTRGGLCGLASLESELNSETLGEGLSAFSESTLETLNGIGGIPYRDLSSELTPDDIRKARDTAQKTL
jgi:tRNA U34 5-methylaminomethyl-2-thiouridine-forming methyltransferase MnmC